MLIVQISKYFCWQAWRTIWTAWCNWQDGRGELNYSDLSDSFCIKASEVGRYIIPRPSELGNGGRDWELDHEERHGQRGHRWRDDQDPQLLPRRNNRGGKHKYFSFSEIEHVLFCKHKYFSFSNLSLFLFCRPSTRWSKMWVVRDSTQGTADDSLQYVIKNIFFFNCVIFL